MLFSVVVGGGMVLAGAALWISPALTLARSGDFKAIDGAENVDEVAMDGGQISLAIAGFVLAVAGAVRMIGGWLRTSGSVTTEGAMLRVEGNF